MSTTGYKAAILDLDGVITRTAAQHARAWKEMFDEFLAHRPDLEGEDRSPFDIERDYVRYVDGKPRLGGVRSFLESRGIELPEGAADDSAREETVSGLGQRKDEIFQRLLAAESVQIFEDAVEQVRRWQERGLRTALITSSRNGRRILAAAGLEDLFEVVVDGNDSERLGIEGKPAPDIFQHAARELGVEAHETIVVEDSLSGVEAGRNGGFGLVVGVARDGIEALRDAGADVVVRDLREVAENSVSKSNESRSEREHALQHMDRITDRLDERRLALFFDYDGTLTPIVRRPEDATLSDGMRSLLRELANRVTVAIISGRDLLDVRKMVALDDLYFAGSHGFDLAGPDDMHMQQDEALEHLPDLDAAQSALEERLKEIDTAWVERKRFAIAVHFREADERDTDRVESAVDEVRNAQPRLRKKGGKKIFELQPDVAWDKGRAVCWLLDHLGLAGPEVLPIYVGDDITDEDAFEALSDRGLGIRVGEPAERTNAAFYLRDTAELEQFCRELLKRLEQRAADHA